MDCSDSHNFAHGYSPRFDFTAGSVLTKEMYEYLHYPVLTPGRSPYDTCSFPIPHVYFFYAMIGSQPALLEKFGTVASEYVCGVM